MCVVFQFVDNRSGQEQARAARSSQEQPEAAKCSLAGAVVVKFVTLEFASAGNDRPHTLLAGLVGLAGRVWAALGRPGLPKQQVTQQVTHR